ncbi:MAG: hypothetical protein ACE5I7_14360, partial [Candidatus Binatia bacterium]
REAERCTAPGAIGALVRREGLYSSYLSTWRVQQAASLEPRQRGRTPQANPLRARVAQLERETLRLQRALDYPCARLRAPPRVLPRARRRWRRYTNFVWGVSHFH